MQPFIYQQGVSYELKLFPHLLEIGSKKIQAILLNSFPKTNIDCFRFYHVLEGKFEWTINGKVYVLFPGDTAILPPGVHFGNENEILEIGFISWIHLGAGKAKERLFSDGSHSGLSLSEQQAMLKVFLVNTVPVISKLGEISRILLAIKEELQQQELGHFTRINQLIDELFITITRYLTRQRNPAGNFPKVFMQLEQELRKDLSHQWTVEEMAAIVGLGTTMFNEKVKGFTGFTPINYLINIRISEAMKMLKKKKVVITDIALETGFYSSQHFSTTFKRLTGYTPSEFRRNHL